MTLDLSKLRQLAEAATPGPWFTPDERRMQGAVSANIDGRERQVASADGQAPMFDDRAETHVVQAANAAFIAAAREAVPALCDEVKRLRSALGWQMRLADGAIHCEHGTCLATIDLVLIGDSAWHVNQAGWWYCPAHLPTTPRVLAVRCEEPPDQEFGACGWTGLMSDLIRKPEENGVARCPKCASSAIREDIER